MLSLGLALGVSFGNSEAVEMEAADVTFDGDAAVTFDGDSAVTFGTEPVE